MTMLLRPPPCLWLLLLPLDLHSDANDDVILDGVLQFGTGRASGTKVAAERLN
jgi:hypothetical protein